MRLKVVAVDKIQSGRRLFLGTRREQKNCSFVDIIMTPEEPDYSFHANDWRHSEEECLQVARAWMTQRTS